MSVVGIPSSGQAKEVLESYNKIRAFAPIAKAMCKLNLHTFNWLQLTSHSDNDTTRRIRFSTRKPSNPYLPVAIKRKRLRGAGRKASFKVDKPPPHERGERKRSKPALNGAFGLSGFFSPKGVVLLQLFWMLSSPTWTGVSHQATSPFEDSMSFADWNFDSWFLLSRTI